MSETLLQVERFAAPDVPSYVLEQVGKITVLEALAEDSPLAISPDKSHRSTQMGNGVDAEDD